MSTNTAPAGDAGGATSPHTTVGGLEPLLSIETLAEYVGVPVVTICGLLRWRMP